MFADTSSLITAVSISENVFTIQQGDDGHLIVKKAKPENEFELIHVETSPLNRINFCSVNYNNSCFYIFGGTGQDIHEFEIWKFDCFKNTWHKLTNNSQTKLHKISAHSVSMTEIEGNLIAFLFGGKSDFLMQNDLIIFSLSKHHFTFKKAKISNTKLDNVPCSRCFASMTILDTNIKLFGGISENGEVLNDFWEFDFSLFETSPKWRKIPFSDGPQNRFKHIACVISNFNQNSSSSNPNTNINTGHNSSYCGKIFIAGGIGQGGKKLVDVWKFNRKWIPVNTFVSENPVIFHNNEIYEIGNKLQKAQVRTLYQSLDGMFDNLNNTFSFYEHEKKEAELRLDLVNKENENLNDKIKKISQYNENKTQIHLIQEIIDDFSETKKVSKIHRIYQNKIDLSNKVKEILEIRKMAINNNEMESIKSTLSLIINAKETSLKHKIQNRELEISLCENQKNDLSKKLNFLNGQESNPIDSSLIKVDPSDFYTFEKHSHLLNVNESKTLLENFYELQLRTYQQINLQINEIKRKNEAIDKKDLIYNRLLKDLSTKLKKKQAKIESNEEEIAKWENFVNEIEDEIKTDEEIINVGKKYENSNESNPIDIDGKLNKLNISIYEVVNNYNDFGKAINRFKKNKLTVKSSDEIYEEYLQLLGLSKCLDEIQQNPFLS
ncbi:hypothetical protein TRFO_19578 [Tritrichomonas foetus]|uniref:Kelch motif family protein n=1 Tax=Tritrichomonas foetus TaxID=1144522 RepID=A0A1J4KID5_9EUKA|nr:hypothetical protein TRFO_19578 [Tritrichomonas foetus]|eukprot:OHT10987.1 hypothetical protein TRFO_19578 [Tritrichomonas foetus]